MTSMAHDNKPSIDESNMRLPSRSSLVGTELTKNEINNFLLSQKYDRRPLGVCSEGMIVCNNDLNSANTTTANHTICGAEDVLPHSTTPKSTLHADNTTTANRKDA